MPSDKPEDQLQGRVVPFRRPGSPSGSRIAPIVPQPASPVEDLSQYERTHGEDDYRHRMLMNGVAALVTVLLIAGGIWIANSMAQLRKNQDCVMSGRRNCNPPVAAEPITPDRSKL
jgi:hypothetical protein